MGPSSPAATTGGTGGGRIDAVFRGLRSAGRGGLMPFVTGGFPSLDVTERVIPALAEAGADVIEVGIPFSDPIADGPVIAGSMHDAILAGATPARVFESVRRARERVACGLVAMVSHSIVARTGADRFVASAAEAGFDGLIIPDIDVDEADLVARAAAASGLSFAMLVAPTTGPARLARLCALSSGFVYLLARTGITGERDAPPEIEERVAAIRAVTPLPIAAGFGISTRAHVEAVTRTADAAIIGTAIVRRMRDAAASPTEDPVRAAADFVRSLR